MDYTYGAFRPTASRPELKNRAKAALSGKWGSAVLAMLIFFLLQMGCGIIPVLGTIILVPPLQFGLVYFLYQVLPTW